MDLKTPLVSLAGIGPAFSSRLKNLNLKTVEDLINHYPFRYDDFSKNQDISQTQIGETVTLKGEIWSIKNIYTRYGKVLTQAIFNDGSGTLEIIWFNQPWLTKNIKAGDRLQVSGKINRKGNKTTLVSPVWERSTPEVGVGVLKPRGLGIHTGGLIPIYPETYGLSSKWLRYKISKILPNILEKIEDPMPDFISQDLLPLKDALKQIHFPDDLDKAKKARDRLAFDELFYIQLSSQKTRGEWQKKEKTEKLSIDEQKLTEFINSLPFKLTKAQEKVVEEIKIDLQKTTPMNRLLQGDVGSGKTIIAAISAFITHQNNLKTIIMAPTEILAFQHFETLKKFLEPYGIEVGIYTGSKKFTKQNYVIAIRHKPGKQSTQKQIATGCTVRCVPRNDNSQPDVIVGTHALLSKKLQPENVGLIIIDEQQRFGVSQRSLLRAKARSPHFLTMTATPIPRTVALTLYGDLDLSVIDEMPVGRKVVRTHFVPQKKRADAYKFMEKIVKDGQQIYIITPLIELSETMTSAKAVKVEFERLKKDIFPKLRLGLLHGRLKPKEKDAVILQFKNHEIDILVSTSVVEVGMDIPNAAVMVIEGAERFGLSQLHQLRGRVGRSDKQSYAFLFTESEQSSIVSRIKHLEKIYSGLKLAELDLKIRGGGEIFSTLQSGRWELKIASFSDLNLIEKTKTAVSKILSESLELDKYPVLRAKLSNLEQRIMPD
ncbi:MAG: ATP-dependent DNA helicase RecG [Candidatus Daviesbacteria bacterium]|nr:ATP-dependent DNA helicase RecG [Candidatus Daviesbacteria bacterium]